MLARCLVTLTPKLSTLVMLLLCRFLQVRGVHCQSRYDGHHIGKGRANIGFHCPRKDSRFICHLICLLLTVTDSLPSFQDLVTDSGKNGERKLNESVV